MLLSIKNLLMGTWSERHWRAFLNRVGGPRQLKNHLSMACGSIHYSVALMDNGQTVGDNITELLRTNPKAYRRMFVESRRISLMYHWFRKRIPEHVDRDVSADWKFQPYTPIGQ